MQKSQWEEQKMKEIFDEVQKMKDGKVSVKHFDSVESFINAVK